MGQDEGRMVEGVSSVEERTETSGRKGVWDKLSIAAPGLASIAGIIVAAVGGVFTHLYNERQSQYNEYLNQQNARIAKIEVIEKFMPYLTKSEEDRQNAIIMVAALELDLAVQIALRYTDTASVEALRTIAAAGDEVDQAAVYSALGTMAAIDTSGQEEVVALARESLNEIQAAEAATIRGAWGVIVGGGKTLEASSFEAQRARNSGYAEVLVYNRRGYYRTVVQFSNRSDARAALPDLRKRIRRSAYIVNLDRWCPGGQDRDGYSECPGGGPSK